MVESASRFSRVGSQNSVWTQLVAGAQLQGSWGSGLIWDTLAGSREPGLEGANTQLRDRESRAGVAAGSGVCRAGSRFLGPEHGARRERGTSARVSEPGLTSAFRAH